MRINNNLMAMNTHRQLGINNTATSKSLEKLSSGFRINRAGDDAAGLAISEKMRGQIRGLNMASKNAQDGISLIQTAEGGLNETHAILQRMRELAVQSANDTNVEVDRGEIQKEIDQLSKEITRIANTTEFNTQKLLNGDKAEKALIFHIGANEGQNVQLAIDAMDAKSLAVDGTVYKATDVIDNIQVTNMTDGKVSIKFAEADSGTKETTAKFVASETDGETGTITVTLGKDTSAIVATNAEVKAALESVAKEAGIVVSTKDGFDGTAKTTAGSTTTKEAAAKAEDATATRDGGINVSSQEAADSAITVINNAIETVSTERSKLGAMQNRLEHTIKNLDTSAENLQAAESRIRDVDMAKEMMEFTKQNILQQAATAMLAQANQAPQTVLQLLR